MKNARRRAWLAALASLTTASMVLAVPSTASPAPEIAAGNQVMANLDHLNFLLDQAAPPEVDGHTTYRLADQPDLTFPWTYAEPGPDGTYERIGGGAFDPDTGHYSQGAFNADDLSRSAVVYLRHWEQTGAASSRNSAYELLRSLAYLQTSSGPHAGNVVLWMQADGTLNPSAEPVELPDPSDSGPSYWLARTIWAFGEGYAAFRDQDPVFAAFLQDRLRLAVAAVERQVLIRYGDFAHADGMRVPAWLIVDGADATAEAVLGLSAYVEAAPDDTAARSALAKLSEGIAAMAAPEANSWPYGAILPWAQSRSVWHAWGSLMPASLARAAGVLGDQRLLQPAVTDSARFTPALLTAGGPDNGWLPTPTERVQIAYGVDSRLQSLLAVADAGERPGFENLAVLVASWYFGANPAGEPMYDSSSGRTFDGVQADGTVNRNSGAESTIHGLLSVLALDARPDLRDRAVGLTSVVSRDGLRLVEAEGSEDTTGTVITPSSPWTGESLWSRDYLELVAGDRATIDLGPAEVGRQVEPVSWLTADGAAAESRWSTGHRRLGKLTHAVGQQGITAVPGALLPQPLRNEVPAGQESITVGVRGGTVQLDALLVRPVVSRLALGGSETIELVHSSAHSVQRVTVGETGVTAVAHMYDTSGRLVWFRAIDGRSTVNLHPGGFLIVGS